MERKNRDKLIGAIAAILQAELEPISWQWLHQSSIAFKAAESSRSLQLPFSLCSRKVGKGSIALSDSQHAQLQEALPGWSVKGWPFLRLSRLWLLMAIPEGDEENYYNSISPLFYGADMNELVALYSALPVFYRPEIWTMRCAEGIRSNIGHVLEAIMYHNPYPAAHLDEPAWNQLVLKAFFNDKDMELLIGLQERNNATLARELLHYAAERTAAGRAVSRQLWPLTFSFMNDPENQAILKGVLAKLAPEERTYIIELYGERRIPHLSFLS